MDLPSVVNAPRVLRLADRTYRARTLSLGQLGEILAWIEDVVPADPDNPAPVPFSDDRVRVALASIEGIGILIHLAVESCHPDMTRDVAIRLAQEITLEQHNRLLEICFHRRRGWKPAAEGQGQDLNLADWGWQFARVIDPEGAMSAPDAAGYRKLSQLTLDQYECFMTRGKVDPDVIHDGEDLSVAEVQRMWEAAQTAEPTEPVDPLAGLRDAATGKSAKLPDGPLNPDGLVKPEGPPHDSA
jgi:hypothetical protein